MDRHSIRNAFRRSQSTTKLARVTPLGFIVDDERHYELVGRPLGYKLLRKLFEDSVLVCDSSDGLRARNGTLCEACRHPQCRPQLRLQLYGAPWTYVIDLAVTSAENLFAVEDRAMAQNESIERWTLRLTVKERGSWGEVLFERVTS